jgi:hypothetical protein
MMPIVWLAIVQFRCAAGSSLVALNPAAQAVLAKTYRIHTHSVFSIDGATGDAPLDGAALRSAKFEKGATHVHYGCQPTGFHA